MKNMLFVLSVFLILPAVSFAKNLTLNNGATFKDIKVTQTTPLGIDFICNGSAGWADFRDMPIDEAKEFGYDPMKAASFEQQLQQNQGCAMPDNSSPEDYVPQNNMNNPDNAPQTNENTIVVNPGDSVPYDTNIIYGGGSPQWVVWNGNRYPYNEWHHWYWNNHWVYSNGRYVPSNYYHQQSAMHNGNYYPYKHNLQPNKPVQPYRTPQNPNGQRFESQPGGGMQYAGGERSATGVQRSGGERPEGNIGGGGGGGRRR